MKNLFKDFKFTKGQTVFVVETDFTLTCRKMLILEIIQNHEYYHYDKWENEYNCWNTCQAIRVLEDGVEKIIPFEEVEYYTFVYTSSQKALRKIKKHTDMTDHFEMNFKSFFGTHFGYKSHQVGYGE